MSKKVISIESMGRTFKDSQELREYCDAQYHTLEAANAKIGQLQDEISHLKDLVATSSQIIQPNPRHGISNEQIICEAQLTFLSKKASERELTLEETKKLDLLVKNLRLLQGKSTSIEAEFRNISDESLLQIASIPDKD